MKKVHTILLADHHEMMLDGLMALINQEPSLRIVGMAHNGEQLVVMAKDLSPDVCIVDIDMPVINGIRAAKIIRERDPKQKIVFLTMHTENSLTRRARQVGALGYLMKTCDSEELIFAIKRALSGKTYYSSDATLADDNISKDGAKVGSLTKRELEVVKLICAGYSNVKIAATLLISPSTADNHRTNIMRKLNKHNVVELTRFCIHHNLA